MKVTKIKPAFVSGGGGEPEPPPPVEERMEVPAGGIVMYTGSNAPTGFEKLDALKFVVVSGSTAVNKTTTTSPLEHTHSYPASSTDPAHAHSMSAPNVGGGGGLTYYGGGTKGVAPSHQHEVGVSSQPSGAHNHPSGNTNSSGDARPPFRVLNFIKNTSGGLAVVPVGSIVMYDGAVSSIPDGWAICDGGNGTVDMREKFAYGATANANLLTSGGSKTHTHPAVDVGVAGAHSHAVTFVAKDASGLSGYGRPSSAGGDNLSEAEHRHYPSVTETGTQPAHTHAYPAMSADHMPLYVYLYYIQRIT